MSPDVFSGVKWSKMCWQPESGGKGTEREGKEKLEKDR